jgi:hypothetical protein
MCNKQDLGVIIREVKGKEGAEPNDDDPRKPRHRLWNGADGY